MSNLSDRLLEQSYVKDEIARTIGELYELDDLVLDNFVRCSDYEHVLMKFAERVIEIWEGRLDANRN